jgi:hypothetical protein
MFALVTANERPRPRLTVKETVKKFTGSRRGPWLVVAFDISRSPTLLGCTMSYALERSNAGTWPVDLRGPIGPGAGTRRISLTQLNENGLLYYYEYNWISMPRNQLWDAAGTLEAYHNCELFSQTYSTFFVLKWTTCKLKRAWIDSYGATSLDLDADALDKHSHYYIKFTLYY